MEKITYAEAQERWASRADAVIDGPPTGYRFCHVGGHFAQVGAPCACKVPVDGSR